MSEIMSQNLPNVAQEELKPMSIDEAIKLIEQMHVITLDKSDPILITNTILADYFIRMQRLHEQHKQATVDVMEEVVHTLSQNIHQEIENYKQTVRSLALENITALLHEHTKNMEAHKESVKNMTLIAVISSGFSFVVCLILLFLK